jgi:hypothetical protein
MSETVENGRKGSKFAKRKQIYETEANIRNGSKYTKRKQIYEKEANIRNGYTKRKQMCQINQAKVNVQSTNKTINFKVAKKPTQTQKIYVREMPYKKKGKSLEKM